jgi:GGDEF domain-containing protein
VPPFEHIEVIWTASRTSTDNFGRKVDAQLLHEYHTRLPYCARTRDLVARLGGGEFAILLCFRDRAIACCRRARSYSGTRIA